MKKENLVSQTLLTIGMPVFNDVEFIEASLNSLMNQTFKEFKLVISDDGSTDGSQDICEKFANQDSRVKYIRQEQNLGISRNMMFLLNQASTKYFMWAGDDDLWDETFIEKLIENLDKNNAVSSFCNFSIINDEGLTVKTYKEFDYTNVRRDKRVINFIKNAHDAFGYGVFDTSKIKGVELPVWWWPNKKSPYNNIYPSLCYYLTKGDYVHISGAPLFFKREKSGLNVNHVLTGENNAIKESLSYWIRKFNLIMFSSKMVHRAGGVVFCVYVFPYLFYYWFIKPSYKQFTLAFISFFKNRFGKRNFF